MSALRLGRGVRLLSQHVDGLELTCSLSQVRLLLEDGTDALDRRLSELQQLARSQTPQCAVQSDWSWSSDGGQDEFVVVLPSPGRPRVRYALECPDWVVYVAAPMAVVPRLSVQCRADYLLRVGPLDAYDAVTSWVEEHLLPFVGGVAADDPDPRWGIARLDLAADVLGGRIVPRRLRDFSTRARTGETFHGSVTRAWNGDMRTHHVGRALTGVAFGRRGASVYARIYDKRLEAAPDAPIRTRWTEALGRDLRERETVWRVEFELRPAFLRDLAEDGGDHLPSAPRAVLASAVGQVWQHLTTRWLVLRQAKRATRLTRTRTQEWWESLSVADAWGQPDGATPALVRRNRSNPDPRPLMRQLAGVLAAYGARVDDADLDQCLRAVERYMRTERGGARGFRDAVLTARLRLPGASRSQADVRAGEPFDARYVGADDLDDVLAPPDLGELRRVG